jgi:hypothetical protein
MIEAAGRPHRAKPSEDAGETRRLEGKPVGRSAIAAVPSKG